MTTKNLVIRAYAESDEAQVIQLWREVFPDNPSWNVRKADIDRKLAVQRELFLVGDLDKSNHFYGDILGFKETWRGGALRRQKSSAWMRVR